MRRAAFILVLLAAATLARNETTEVRGAERGPAPDLAIVEISLSPGRPATAKVHVENRGDARSTAAVLRLTLRGASVEGSIPALAPGSRKSISINAARLLPAGHTLEEMDFRVEADPEDLLGETNEANNRKAHKGVASPRPAGKPDLTIAGTDPISARVLEVEVFNAGDADAGPFSLRLKISEVDGRPAPLPADVEEFSRLAPGKRGTATFDVSSTVPAGSKLRNAVYKLTVDSKSQIDESNEDNNDLLHRPE